MDFPKIRYNIRKKRNFLEVYVSSKYINSEKFRFFPLVESVISLKPEEIICCIADVMSFCPYNPCIYNSSSDCLPFVYRGILKTLIEKHNKGVEFEKSKILSKWRKNNLI